MGTRRGESPSNLPDKWRLCMQGTSLEEHKRSPVRVGTLRALRTQGKRLARNKTPFPLPSSRLDRERLACEQALRGALAEGREKEGEV